MKNLYRSYVVLLILFVFMAVGHAEVILNYKIGSVTGEPFVYEVVPGANMDADALYIDNRYDEEKTVELVFESAVEEGKEEMPVEWVTFDTSNITIGAGLSEVVPWTISVPVDAVEASYVGSFVVKTASNEADVKQEGITMDLAAARPVEVVVKAEIVEEEEELVLAGDEDTEEMNEDESKSVLDTLMDNLHYFVLVLILILLAKIMFFGRKEEKKKK